MAFNLIETLKSFFLNTSKAQRDKEKAISTLEHNELLFPNGEADVIRDCNKVSLFTNNKVDPDLLKEFVLDYKKYLQFEGSQAPEISHFNFIMSRTQDLLEPEEAWKVYAYFEGEARTLDRMVLVERGIMKGAKLHVPVLPSNAEDGSSPHPLPMTAADFLAIYDQGLFADKLPNGKGEYGLSADNPILVMSSRCATRYLSTLLFNNKRVDSTKIGIVFSDVTPGTIEVFRISVKNEPVTTLYISPYHKKNSKLPPDFKGFSIVG